MFFFCSGDCVGTQDALTDVKPVTRGHLSVDASSVFLCQVKEMVLKKEKEEDFKQVSVAASTCLVGGRRQTGRNI